MTSPLIRTGNIAVDAVYHCLEHNKRFKKKVKTILLSHKWWSAFERFAKEKHPEFEFKDAIQFKDVILKKGPAVMIENLMVVHDDKIAN